MTTNNKKKKTPSKLAQWWQQLRQKAQQARTYTHDHYEELHRKQKYYDADAQTEPENAQQPERITMLTVIRILLAELGEKEYWRTLWHLLWRPGYAIADYLNGKRRRFLRPFELLIGTTLLFGAALWIVPADIRPIDSYETRLNQLLVDEEYAQKFSNEDVELLHNVIRFFDQYNHFVHEHIALGLLVKSIWVVVFTWLLFRKSPRNGCPYITDNTDRKKANYNFAEILTVQIFIVAQLQMLNVAWVLVTGWFVPDFTFQPYTYPYILANIIVFIDYQQLFGRKWYSTLWRTLVAQFFML